MPAWPTRPDRACGNCPGRTWHGCKTGASRPAMAMRCLRGFMRRPRRLGWRCCCTCMAAASPLAASPRTTRCAANWRAWPGAWWRRWITGWRRSIAFPRPATTPGMPWSGSLRTRRCLGPTAPPWRFAPLLAPNVDGVAPAWIGLAEYDPLVDEGVAYADKLRLAGVAVELDIYRGVTHEFIKMGRAIPEARQAHADAARALRRAFVQE